MRRLGLLVAALALAACGREAEPAPDGPVAARVGDAALSESELREALGSATPGLDSAAARRQIVEQWVRRQLVVQEARREGLDDEPEVRRLLRDSESAVLESAYLTRFFESEPASPSEPEIQSYFEANQDRLALREPYVRVRLLRLADDAQGPEAQRALVQINGSPIADSLFAIAAREFTARPEGAIALADTYIPESRLIALDETLGLRVTALGAGATPVLVTTDGGTYAVGVVDRVRAGQTPSLEMVRPEIEERLSIRSRKAAEARLIARLRSEAEAGGTLDVRR